MKTIEVNKRIKQLTNTIAGLIVKYPVIRPKSINKKIETLRKEAALLRGSLWLITEKEDWMVSIDQI